MDSLISSFTSWDAVQPVQQAPTAPKNFQALPTELRIMIWQLSIAELEPRVVKIRAVDSSRRHWNSQDEDFRPKWQLEALCNDMIPSLLHVNRESREKLFENYKLVFATRLRHPVYFDFARDFLVFDGDSAYDQFHQFMTSCLQDNDREGEKERLVLHSELRNLALGGPEPGMAEVYHIREIAQFSKLKHLIFRPSNWPWPPATTSAILKCEWTKKRERDMESQEQLSLDDLEAQA